MATAAQAFRPFVDPVLRNVVHGVGRFTRISASSSLTADPTDWLLSPAVGGVLLIGYVVAFVAAGDFLVARRDVA